jgi:hypothetical protein
MQAIRVVAAAIVTLTAFPQTTPSYFELSLPDFGLTVPSGSVVADIPNKPITNLKIHLLGSADKNLNYGSVELRINGVGVGNIVNRKADDKGHYLEMDPKTLANRRDPIFDPRENTIEVYGKDSRKREYYQNWILRTGSEDKNPYFADISTTADPDSGIPPDLEITEPLMPIEGSSKPMQVTISGRTSAAAGFASATINGTPIKSVTGKTATFTEKCTLAGNAKSVAVAVIDKKGNKHSITIPVVYPPTGPPPKIAGQTWAVIVGVSKFQSEKMPPPALTGAAFDAKQVAEQLKARGVPADHMLVLIDEQAKIDRVESALGDFTAKAKPDDFLLVYVATQILHDPANPEKVYVTGYDSQGLKLPDTAFEFEDLKLKLNHNIRSKHTLFFFDGQHALTPEWSFSGKPIVNTLLLSLFDGPMGRSVLVSGAAAGEHEARGVFSAALADALSGKADTDHNKVLTAKEICAYVAQQVRESSKGSQSPQFRTPEAETEVPVLSLK